MINSKFINLRAFPTSARFFFTKNENLPITVHTLHAWFSAHSESTQVSENLGCFRKIFGTFPARERMPERYQQAGRGQLHN